MNTRKIAIAVAAMMLAAIGLTGCADSSDTAAVCNPDVADNCSTRPGTEPDLDIDGAKHKSRPGKTPAKRATGGKR